MIKATTFYSADDDADDRLLLTEAIKTIDPGIEIAEAENGLELLSILQSQTLLNRCLIIVDMNMPKMNGLETLANLRSNPRLASLPAIVLSTSGNAEMIQFAKQLGALHYYIKPTTMDGLLELSRQLVFG